MHVREAPAHDPVRRKATDLGPGRSLIVARKRIGEQLQIEAFLGGQRLEDADRLLSKRVIDVEKCDLDALQLSARFLLDVFDVVRSLTPIGRADREYPFENVAIDGVAAPGKRLNHDIAVLPRV